VGFWQESALWTPRRFLDSVMGSLLGGCVFVRVANYGSSDKSGSWQGC
jgi:hypothetical protein